ncbi:MAG: recombinase family protein [Brumimicrobium sp.]
MQILAYIRISTDKQDLDKQRHLLLEYANANQLIIDEFIEVEISSRKDASKRKINLLTSKLKKGDMLIVAELSRLGRNMFETLNLINQLTEQGISIRFVRQPELSTDASHTKLLLAIYGYFAESERDFISLRTKQGLAAAKASGKILGRPKGSKNKKGKVLEPYKSEILKLYKLNISVASITKIINNTAKTNYSYNTYLNFINKLKST